MPSDISYLEKVIHLEKVDGLHNYMYMWLTLSLFIVQIKNKVRPIDCFNQLVMSCTLYSVNIIMSYSKWYFRYYTNECDW